MPERIHEVDQVLAQHLARRCGYIGLVRLAETAVCPARTRRSDRSTPRSGAAIRKTGLGESHGSGAAAHRGPALQVVHAAGRGSGQKALCIGTTPLSLDGFISSFHGPDSGGPAAGRTPCAPTNGGWHDRVCMLGAGRDGHVAGSGMTGCSSQCRASDGSRPKLAPAPSNISEHRPTASRTLVRAGPTALTQSAAPGPTEARSTHSAKPVVEDGRYFAPVEAIDERRRAELAHRPHVVPGCWPAPGRVRASRWTSPETRPSERSGRGYAARARPKRMQQPRGVMLVLDEQRRGSISRRWSASWQGGQSGPVAGSSCRDSPPPRNAIPRRRTGVVQPLAYESSRPPPVRPRYRQGRAWPRAARRLDGGP